MTDLAADRERDELLSELMRLLADEALACSGCNGWGFQSYTLKNGTPKGSTCEDCAETRKRLAQLSDRSFFIRLARQEPPHV